MNFLVCSFICCVAALQLASASKEEVVCDWVVGKANDSTNTQQISNMNPDECLDTCYRKRKAKQDIHLNGVTIKVKRSDSWCYCESNWNDTDRDPAYKSCKMVFGRYELIGKELTCSEDTLYTQQTGRCNGWSGTTEKECRSKCTLNKLPNGCAIDDSFECKYVLWKSDGLCHLSNIRCELTPGSNEVTLYERRGAALIPDTEGCFLKCGNKGGICESICGDYGFCCRQGKDDCPIELAMLNPSDKKHACIRAPEHVPEEMVKCDWQPGRGKGGKRKQMGGMYNKDCVERCHKLRVTTKDTSINGVTVWDGGHSCWCEYNMEGSDNEDNYKSCKMEFSGEGAMVCDDKKLNHIDDSFAKTIIETYLRVNDGTRSWASLHVSLSVQMAFLHKCLLTGYIPDMYCKLEKASAKFCKLSDSFKSALYMIQDPPERRPILTDIDHNGQLKSEALISFQKEMTLSFIEVKKKVEDIDRKFRQDFGNYLSQIADYEHQIAQQDKIYIFTILGNYKVKINDLNKRVEEMLRFIISALVGKTTLDLATAGARFGSRLALAFNPLGWIFGSTEPGDIEEALAGVFNAVNKEIKAVYLFEELKGIAGAAEKIQDGLKQNAEIHHTFFKLIAQYTDKQGADLEKVALQFSNAYGDFSPSPGLKKEDLASFTSKLGGMLDAACDEIGDSSSTAGNIASTVVYGAGYCSGIKTGVLIDELDAVFEESFDAQFEIMDIGAALAKSVISKELARRVQKDIHKRQSLMDYAMGCLTAAVYRRDVIYAACDAFEYQNFGIVDELCVRIKKEPMLSEIHTLSNKISGTGKLNCDERPRQILIPAYSGAVEKGHINLDDLYNGKAVFHIPNATYAKKNNWILKGDKGKSIYVKQFTLFLPPSEENKDLREDEINIHYGGPNLMNNRTFYLPPNEMVTAYSYNPTRNCQPIEIEPYSYSYCPSLFSSPTCLIRSGEAISGYLPSLYGEWYIFLMNNQNNTDIPLKRLPRPHVKGRLYLQALVKTCNNAIRSGSGYIQNIAKKRNTVENKRKCCGPQNMAVDFEGDNQSLCKSCPENSSPTLEGYYCKETSSS